MSMPMPNAVYCTGAGDGMEPLMKGTRVPLILAILENVLQVGKYYPLIILR